MEYKKTFLATLAAFGSISALSAADIQPWSASKVSSYTPGTLVTEGGNTYKCKVWPEGAWCTIAAYEPTGIYGADAWEKVNSTPTKQVTALVNITGDLPGTAVVEFVNSTGKTFVVSDSKVTLDYPEGSSETYTVELKGDEGSITPSTIQVNSQTTSIELSYKALPAPIYKDFNVSIGGDELPSDAVIKFTDSKGKSEIVSNGKVQLQVTEGKDTTYNITVSGQNIGSITPSSVKLNEKSANTIALTYKNSVSPSDCDPYDASKVPAYSDSTVYSGKDFAKYDGGIYEAQWWTQNEAPGTNDVWKYCGQAVEAKVSVNTTGLPQTVKTFEIVIGGESYTIDSTRQTPIVLGQGSFDVSVPKILSSDASEVYIANKVTPNPIVVDESTKEVSLNISFKTEAVEATTVSLNVTYATGTSPNSTTAKVTNSSGYEQTVQLVNGSNTINISSQGEFTITPNSYKEGGVTYVANTIKVKDGEVDGNNKIVYEQAPNVLVGYLPVWGGSTNPKISDAAKAGYNIVAVAFVDVKGESPVKFTGDGSFASYGTELKGEQLAKTINADITKAKEQDKLKYALISVGGEKNTFDPGNADMAVVASNIISFLRDYGFDGVDFDLEQVPFTDNQLIKLMQDLKKDMPSIIMSGAPQVNRVQDLKNPGNYSLQYVNTGTQQVYNKALEAGLFNYMFVQDYNTGGNFVNAKGDLYDPTSPSDTKDAAAAHSAGYYDVYDPEFISNSVAALKKITPENTKIVIGEPATPSAAGLAQIFHGPSADNAYEAMCEQFFSLNTDSSYGGAMTWQIVFDKENDYTFAKAVKASEENNCQNF